MKDVERPQGLEKDGVRDGAQEGVWGSDLIADMLRALDVKYVALNPGSSFRGLHDSLVNHLGNENPQMLLCLHEEHTVAIAHGWAKVTGEPMAAIVHSNVGLMHASMAIYNAWCDRVPVLIFGATGPVDATKRRPWIDWIHTSRDQAALVRDYVKWDDQPASITASLEAMLRSSIMARTAPMGPTYVCFDVEVQEERLDSPPPLPSLERYHLPEVQSPSRATLKKAASLIKAAEKPVILMGRVSRATDDWAARLALAESLGARVITDIKLGAAFPTDHPLHAGVPSFFLSPQSAAVIKHADLILSLDWVDLGGTLKSVEKSLPHGKIIQVSLDHHLHRAWSLDHQALAPADIHVQCDPDVFVHALSEVLCISPAAPPKNLPAKCALPRVAADVPLDISALAACLGVAFADEVISFIRLPLGWAGDAWHFRHPMDYLGYDGGAGIGSGPGMLVGAALAMKESPEHKDRLPVAVLGDGDYLMGISALWTGARYRVPFLAIIANNRSFYNDEIHQEKVAIERARPVENKWIGQHIGGPDIDLAALARAQGLEAIGPVSTTLSLIDAVRSAIALVKEGKAVVIDARVEPGYTKAMSSGMTRSADETASG